MNRHSLTTLTAALCWVASAQAHEGHGQPGPTHWHAGDTGWALACLALAAGLWFKLRK